MIIRKEEVNGLTFRIKENDTYIEYTVNRKLIIGLNKENRTILQEDEMIYMPFEESDLNLLSDDEMKELMMADLELRLDFEYRNKLVRPRKDKAIPRMKTMNPRN